MSYRFYGLIISLSISVLFCPGSYAKEKNETEATSALQNGQDRDINAAVIELQKDIQQLSDQLTLITSHNDTLDAKFRNLSASLSTAAITSQLNQIRQEQIKIYDLFDSLKANQFDMQQSTASYENQIVILKQEQQDISSLLLKINENQEKLKDELAQLAGRIDKSSGTREPKQSIQKESSGIVPSEIELDETSGQQYIKLKLIENGQEVELYLDPSYVDMNLDLSKIKEKSKKVAQNRENPSDFNNMLEYVNTALEKRYTPGTSSPQQSTSGAPQYTYNITNPPPSPSSSPYGSPDHSSASQPYTQEDPKALDDLYEAQKYFYDKNYIAALRATQRSLAKQESALSYALEGSIYFTMGENDLAITSWESALRINPDMPEVKRALNKYRR